MRHRPRLTAARVRAAGPEEALVLLQEVADQLSHHADRERPAEACAIVSGPDPTTAARVHLARNALASPYRYDLHPEDLVRIVARIEAAGEVMVATFHSHPAGPAVPSATDLREARWPVVHLVAGGAPEPALRGWRIRDGRAVEVRLVPG